MLKSVGADKENINQCIKSSFDVYDLDKCSSNRYFEEEKQLMEKHEVLGFPSVSINGYIIKGDLSVQNLFLTISELLVDRSLDYQEALNGPSPKKSSSLLPFVIGFLIVTLIIVVIFFMRRSMKKETHEQAQKDIAFMVQQQYQTLN